MRQQTETDWKECRPGSAAIYPGQPKVLSVSWTIGVSPDANLVNTMLDRAIGTLNEMNIQQFTRIVAHSTVEQDGLNEMENIGLVRSMSKKGCSPDNSACEGFFGWLKKEMFYGCFWRVVTIEEFIKTFDEYIHL